MRRLLFLLVLVGVPAGAASAGPKQDGLKAILTCLTKAEETGAFGGSCIGVVATPCITAARGKPNYQAETRQCAARELYAWTEVMQRAVSEAGRATDAAMKTAVAESQKAWAQSREKLCPIFENLDPGMSLGGSDYCRLQETAIRALSLRRLATAVNPH